MDKATKNKKIKSMIQITIIKIEKWQSEIFINFYLSIVLPLSVRKFVL
jgi:hypothetical protein